MCQYKVFSKTFQKLLTQTCLRFNIGDNLRVGDLSIEGCNILLNDSVLLFACKRTRAAMSLDSETEDAGDEAGDAEGGDDAAEGSEE